VNVGTKYQELYMARKLYALLRDKRAATAIEYGLIMALIAIACVASFTNLAGAISSKWNFVATTVLNA